jgi:hypothetical protein
MERINHHITALLISAVFLVGIVCFAAYFIIPLFEEIQREFVYKYHYGFLGFSLFIVLVGNTFCIVDFVCLLTQFKNKKHTSFQHIFCSRIYCRLLYFGHAFCFFNRSILACGAKSTTRASWWEFYSLKKRS